MASKGWCDTVTCVNYRKTRTITDEDEERGWDFCWSCEGLLQPIETLVNDSPYNQEPAHKECFTCVNESCISQGDPIYLDLMQLEDCQDFCCVCGEQMMEYSKVNFPSFGLSELYDEQDRVELEEKKDAWDFIQGGSRQNIKFSQTFKINGDDLIKTEPRKENVYPVVYLSTGLKSKIS